MVFIQQKYLFFGHKVKHMEYFNSYKIATPCTLEVQDVIRMNQLYFV
jgi:hypothetical protein